MRAAGSRRIDAYECLVRRADDVLPFWLQAAPGVVVFFASQPWPRPVIAALQSAACCEHSSAASSNAGI